MSEDAVATDVPTFQNGREFMDMIIYGQKEGWDKPTKEFVGHKGFVEDLIRSRRYNALVDDEMIPLPEGAIADVKQSTELQDVLQEARESFIAAEAAMKDGLVTCEDWLGLRDRFYDSGAIFAIAGYPDDASKCFLHATFINRAFHDDDEAVSTLTMAAEGLKVAHPEIAVEVLSKLASCYTATNNHFQAARCLKEAAEILDGRMNNKEGSIELYKAAIECYEKTKNISYGMHKSLISTCHERMCFLHTELGHYDIAEKLFLEKARSIPSNLPATRFYMYATLCVLARGGGSEDAYFDTLYDTKKVFDKLQMIDRGYQTGKEFKLVRAIIAAYDNNSLSEYDIALMEYKSYSTTIPNAAFDIVTEQCRDNLFAHLERYG